MSVKAALEHWCTAKIHMLLAKASMEPESTGDAKLGNPLHYKFIM